jgi:putative sugar O-methyltransferase
MAVSQDLANSLLEFESIHAIVPPSEKLTVLELGAGYGRDAYVMLKLRPNVKYVIVDIPPALWVAERYLSEVFPETNMFRARSFEHFDQIADDFARADIVFLLSTQLSLLPPGSIDVALNISSLHEMRKEQIAYYCECFDRILKSGGHFYLKQWKRAAVLFEGVTLAEEDYPIPHSWNKVFSRTARVQTKFFEALYQKAGG